MRKRFFMVFIFMVFISVFFIFGCASRGPNDFSGLGFGGVYYNRPADLTEKPSGTETPGPNDSRQIGFGGRYYPIPAEQMKQEVASKENGVEKI